MTKTTALKVLTPAQVLLAMPAVAWVQAQLIDGSIGIWPGHAPLLAQTVTAPLVYAQLNEAGHQTIERTATLAAGILQIDQEGVTIFTGGFVEGVQDNPDIGFERLTRALRSM